MKRERVDGKKREGMKKKMRAREREREKRKKA